MRMHKPHFTAPKFQNGAAVKFPKLRMGIGGFHGSLWFEVWHFCYAGHVSGMRLGILGSGSGSNMKAILDAIEQGTLDAGIALVLSDNPGAYILERASRAGLTTGVIDCRGFKTKYPEEAQTETAAALKDAGVDLVCLAGFMRLVKAPLLEAFPGRILNIHPSLLPAFPGLAAWDQAVAAGVGESGCTVHLVDGGMDSGPVVLQAKVAVYPGDTGETLHQRIQVEEHRLYPEAIRILAAQLGL
jgi:phosphoribosylglycinamide formyltransferase-1